MLNFSTACYLGKKECALLAAIGIAAMAFIAPHAQAEPDVKNLAQLQAIYVADPAAPWFEKWTEANLKPRNWLYRPDIKIKKSTDLVAAVASSPSAIGLLTRGELSRLQSSGAPKVEAAATGLSVCAALLVNESQRETSFGDFALSGDNIEVVATSDTRAIAEALIDTHRFKDRMTLKEVDASAAIAELSSGNVSLAAWPVLPQSRLDLPDSAAGLSPIEISEAAIAALRLRGLDPQKYRTSFLQRLPLIDSTRTACDEIVMISAPDKAIDPKLFRAASTGWTNPLAGSDLEKRIRQALEALKSLWQNSLEIKG